MSKEDSRKMSVWAVRASAEIVIPEKGRVIDLNHSRYLPVHNFSNLQLPDHMGVISETPLFDVGYVRDYYNSVKDSCFQATERLRQGEDRETVEAELKTKVEALNFGVQ